MSVDNNRTVFALGFGDGAEVLGAFVEELDPSDLTRLPIGQRLLHAGDTATVRECFARFALAYDTAGFGAFVPTRRDAPLPETVPQRRVHAPYDQRQDVFTFTNGAWWIWRDHGNIPQWFALEATPSGVREQPWARDHGARVSHTRELGLTQLTMWILAEATVYLGDHGIEFSTQLHMGDSATDADIHVTAHQVPEHETDAVTATLETLAAQYNWTNPHDVDDVRFHFSTHCTARPKTLGQPTLEVIPNID